MATLSDKSLAALSPCCLDLQRIVSHVAGIPEIFFDVTSGDEFEIWLEPREKLKIPAAILAGAVKGVAQVLKINLEWGADGGGIDGSEMSYFRIIGKTKIA